MVSKNENNKSKIRTFGNQKAETKALALLAWKGGMPIAEIARELGRTRPTIYRWIKNAPRQLGKNSSRIHHKIDLQTKFRMIELFILLKAPSIRRLSEHLKNLFHIRLSETQIRYALKKWGIAEFKPSPFFDALIREQAGRGSDRGKVRVQESARKSAEDSEFSVSVNP